MNSSAFLDTWTSRLRAAGIGTARLDVMVLLEDCLRTSRAHILAHPEIKLAEEQIEKLEKWLRRRAQHEPLAYIRGFSEFYGRQFKVDKRVLQPRPESETMIDLLKQAMGNARSLGGSKPLITDIGTGCGALAITAHLEIPAAQVIATDIDSGCLAVARKNAKTHKANIQFLQGDLFYPLSTTPYALFAVLANLPYVPSYHYVNEAAGHEPRLAVYGGGDGLEVYRRLFNQLAANHDRPRFVLTESLPTQHQNLADIAALAGYRERQQQDFIQIFANID